MNKQQIKHLRKSLKLTTKEFGKLVGVSGRTVEAWEQGLRQPSKSALITMPRLLLSKDKLLCEICGKKATKATRDITSKIELGDSFPKIEPRGVWHSRCDEHERESRIYEIIE